MSVTSTVPVVLEPDAQAFAEAVIRLLNDPEYAGRLGRAGRQFVIERYSWAGAAENLGRLYDAIALAPTRQEALALVAGKETSV